MCALYAFLRHTDDLADESGLGRGEGRRARCLAARARRGARLGRATAWPGFPALADTVARHGIPPALLHEVDRRRLDGHRAARRSRSSTNWPTTAITSPRSSVCAACASGAIAPQEGEAERLAERCGIALQLTNIIRDVRDDARNGRIYLPQEDLARFGVEPRRSRRGRPSQRAVRDLLAFEAQRAYEFYDHARRLDPLVAPVGRPVLRTIVGIYRALLDEIVERDYDVFSSRMSLPPWRKIAIALGGLAGRYAARDRDVCRADTSAVASDSIASRSMNPRPKPPPPHVVIVGGGLAGLAAASCAGRSRPADHAPREPPAAGRPRQLVSPTRRPASWSTTAST